MKTLFPLLLLAAFAAAPAGAADNELALRTLEALAPEAPFARSADGRCSVQTYRFEGRLELHVQERHGRGRFVTLALHRDPRATRIRRLETTDRSAELVVRDAASGRTERLRISRDPTSATVRVQLRNATWPFGTKLACSVPAGDGGGLDPSAPGEWGPEWLPGQASPYENLGALFKAGLGTVPDLPDLFGATTGRCFHRDEPSRALNSLLLGWVDNNTDPLDPRPSFLEGTAIAYGNGADCGPACFDRLSPEVRYWLPATLADLRPYGRASTVEHGSRVLGVQRPGFDEKFHVRKHEGYLIAVSKVVRESGLPEPGVRCFFFRRVLP